MKRNFYFFLMIVAVMATASMQAQPDAVTSFTGTALESFNYTAGESLIGQTASAEFDGVWSSSGADWDGTAEIIRDGLTYPGG